MRISNNFNMIRPNFRGMQLSEQAVPIVDAQMRNQIFASAYDELEKKSDLHEADIYVGKGRRANSLNFQVIDTYSRDTLCYLAANSNPQDAVQQAVRAYDSFLKAELPPKSPMPKDKPSQLNTKENRPPKTGRKRWLFGLV